MSSSTPIFHDEDRKHLLAPSKASSIAPSDSASIYTARQTDGDRTPRAHSPAPEQQGRRATLADPTPIPQPYKGFPSEAHYLAALRAWADSKRYVEQEDTALIGFYGETTMEEYASRPKLEFGLSKRLKARKERKAAEARRKSAVQ